MTVVRRRTDIVERLKALERRQRSQVPVTGSASEAGAAYNLPDGSVTLRIGKFVVGGRDVYGIEATDAAGTPTVWSYVYVDTGEVAYSSGPKGDPGPAATLQVGATTTSAPGAPAAVSNSGSSAAAVLDFTLPRGEPGPPGSSASVYEYTLSTSTAVPPGAGQARTDTTEATTATRMYLAHELTTGAQVAPLLRNITTGDILTVQEHDDSAAYAEYKAIADAVDRGTYADVPVAYLTGTIPAGKNNQRILIFHQMLGADGDPGPPGDGYRWRGTWTSGLALAVNDVVFYSSHAFLVVNATSTTTAPHTGLTTPFKVFTQGLNPRGAWAAATVYRPGDVVSYTGHTWACYLSPAAGTAPATPSAYWYQLVQGLNPRGVWAAGTAYLPGDVVTYSGYGFIARSASTGSTPNTGADTASWAKFVDAGTVGAAASVTVGTTTTGAAGAAAAVANSGTPTAAVLDFTIPRGFGVPAGGQIVAAGYGTGGQVLAKSTSVDYATGWVWPRVLCFDNTADRDAAVPSPVPGMQCITTDRNMHWVCVTIAGVARWAPVPGQMVASVVQQGAQQSIPDSPSMTVVKCETNLYSPLVWHDAVTGRFQPTIPGWYQFVGAVTLEVGTGTPATTGYRVAYFRTGPASVSQPGGMSIRPNGLTATNVPASALVQLDGSTQYVELCAAQTSGAALKTMVSGYQRSTFTVTYAAAAW